MDKPFQINEMSPLSRGGDGYTCELALGQEASAKERVVALVRESSVRALNGF